MTASTLTPGPDHAAPKQGSWGKVKEFAGYAKKAIYAFLVSGVAGGLAPALAGFDFTHLTWGNFWTGLGSGLVGSVLVYVARNKASTLGIPPELEVALESIVDRRFGTFENKLLPKVMVRGDDGRLRKPAAVAGDDERAPLVR